MLLLIRGRECLRRSMLTYFGRVCYTVSAVSICKDLLAANEAVIIGLLSRGGRVDL